MAQNFVSPDDAERQEGGNDCGLIKISFYDKQKKKKKEKKQRKKKLKLKRWGIKTFCTPMKEEEEKKSYKL